MESSGGTGPRAGGFGKSVFDKKPLGEKFGNKDVFISLRKY
jgi:hypothetical protein